MLFPSVSSLSCHLRPWTHSGLDPASPKSHSNFGVVTVFAPSVKVISAEAGAAATKRQSESASASASAATKPSRLLDSSPDTH